jgi:DNA-binding transcriptional LysR family regulator
VSLTRFRYFFKVARLGSVREASAVLHVASSAISRQIDKLEKEMGAELFEPKGRGIRLTAAGEILARQVGLIIDSLEQAHSQIDDLLGLQRGHVHLWTVEGSVGDLVMPAIASFRKDHPAVTYEITVASSDRIIAALVEDDADLGIVFNPPELTELVSVGQGVNALHGILHPRHPAVRARRITFRDFASYPLALPDRSFGLRHMIDAAAKVHGVKLEPVLTTNSIEGLRAFARAGAGVTILPPFAVVSDLKQGTLRTRSLLERELRMARTAILARRDRQLPLVATRIAEYLLKTMKVSSR